MTAEELKNHVREYAAEHFPGWEVGSVMIRGKTVDEFERLLVLPTSSVAEPASPPPAPSQEP